MSTPQLKQRPDNREALALALGLNPRNPYATTLAGCFRALLTAQISNNQSAVIDAQGHITVVSAMYRQKENSR